MTDSHTALTDSRKIVRKSNCVTVQENGCVIGTFAGPDCELHAAQFAALSTQPPAVAAIPEMDITYDTVMSKAADWATITPYKLGNGEEAIRVTFEVSQRLHGFAKTLTDCQAVIDEILKQRDYYHDVADDLAAQIAAITGEDIGEHSSSNNPWQNAANAATEYRATPRAPATSGEATAAQGADCPEADLGWNISEAQRAAWHAARKSDPDSSVFLRDPPDAEKETPPTSGGDSVGDSGSRNHQPVSVEGSILQHATEKSSAAPVRGLPLTESQADGLMQDFVWDCPATTAKLIIRATEAAHGIGLTAPGGEEPK